MYFCLLQCICSKMDSIGNTMALKRYCVCGFTDNESSIRLKRLNCVLNKCITLGMKSLVCQPLTCI